MEESTKKLLKVKDIQKIYGFGRDMTYKLFSLEGFPSIKIGSQYFVDQKKMEEWLDDASKRK